ncbi:MAG: hypothetical protein REI11_01670 [Patulibacter sp.]|nr:hypothetical protein [Patulibacter sp.]
MRSSRLLGLKTAAALAAAALAAGGLPGVAAARPRTHVATCDEAPGVTVRASAAWRIFRVHAGEITDPGALWACRRGPSPTTRFALIDPNIIGVTRIAGDLVGAYNSGRYNPEAYVLDLSTLRIRTIYDATTLLDAPGLTASGAILTGGYAPGTAPTSSPRPTPVFQTTIDDAEGLRVFTAATGSADGAAPADAVAVADAGGATGDVVYGTGPGGQVVTTVAHGPVAAAALGSVDQESRWVRKIWRVRSTPGVRTTILAGAGYRLVARAARRGHHASLTLRLPAPEVVAGKHVDLVARLAPGSEADVRVVDGIVIGRFADDPGELRARLPVDAAGTPTYRFDLPAPARDVPGATTSGVDGSVAIATADAITIAFLDGPRRTWTIRTLPVAGASQLATWDIADGMYAHGVYWTAADGTVGRYAFATSGR